MEESGSPLFEGIPLERWFIGPKLIRMLEYLGSLSSVDERLSVVHENLQRDTVRWLAISVPFTHTAEERDAYFRDTETLKRHARMARCLTLTLLRERRTEITHGQGEEEDNALLVPVPFFNWLTPANMGRQSYDITNAMLRFVDAFAYATHEAQSLMFAVVVRILSLDPNVAAWQWMQPASNEQVREAWLDMRVRWRWDRGHYRYADLAREWFAACLEFTVQLRKRFVVEMVYHGWQRPRAVHRVRLLKHGAQFLADQMERPHLAKLPRCIQSACGHFLVVWMMRELGHSLDNMDHGTVYERVDKAVLYCEERPPPPDMSLQVKSVWDLALLQRYDPHRDDWKDSTKRSE